MLNEGLNLTNNRIEAKKGITFYELIQNKSPDKIKDIAICKLNGKYHELTEEIKEDGIIEMVPFNTDLGIQIYIRTLQFIFIKSALDLFKDSKITIEHSVSKARDGEIKKEVPLSKEDIKKIKK